MKTTKRLIWGCIIVTLIAGACFTGAGIAFGGTLHDGFGIHYGFSSRSSSKKTQTLPVDAFSSLTIDLTMGDIEVKEGAGFEVKIKDIPEDEYHVSIEQDTLKITTSQTWKFSIHMNALDYKVSVTVPKGTALENINIHSSMGDVTLDTINCTYVNIDQDMGDIDIRESKVNGDVEVDNRMGDIKFAGQVLGNMKVDDAMGDIKLLLNGSEAEYSYDLSTSMGDIKINGESSSDGVGGREKGGANSAAYHIEASDSMGDIKLEFLK